MERKRIMTDDPVAEAKFRESKKVRPYSVIEKVLLSRSHPTGSVERLTQIINRIQIDGQRYAEAKVENPDMTDHFTRLQEIGSRAVTGWKQHYEEQYDITLPVVMPYDGTENWHEGVTLALQFSHRTVNEDRVNLPA